MRHSILTGATNPILRTQADPITDFGDDLLKLALDMKLVCHQYDGVGLAAPQIGILLRVIYTTQRKKTPKGLKYITDQIMINPTLILDSGTTNSDIEGCLSLPGIEGKVRRFDRVKVSFQDTDGKTISKIYKGFDARIIQHEIDHLDGILFIDRATSVRKT